MQLARRTVLLTGGSAVVGLAGCLSTGSDGGPEERSFTLTLTRSETGIEGTIEPAGAVADVVQVAVGDSVTFTVLNDAEVSIAIHNHADDTEEIVDAGDDTELSFEATEAMTGRHEIEGWVVEEADGAGDHDAATTLVVIEVRPRGS